MHGTLRAASATFVVRNRADITVDTRSITPYITRVVVELFDVGQHTQQQAHGDGQRQHANC